MSKQDKKKPTKGKEPDSNRAHIYLYIGLKGLGFSEFAIPRVCEEVKKFEQKT